jgi:cell wall-associated NlpC family hydrolase
VSDSLAAVQARVVELQALLGFAGAAPKTSNASRTAGFASLLAGAMAGTSTTAATAAGTGGVGATSTVDLGAAAVAKAKEYSGVPYLWGGEDPKTGVDCSGLVQTVYSQLGIDLPRVAADQSRAGTRVASLDQARPGDLVFFGSPAHHVGIYVGDGRMIDAPRAGKTVGVHRLWGTPSSIRRVVPEVASTVPSTAGSGTAGPTGPYAELFAAAGARHGVDPALLSAVAKAESGYNPRAVSQAGAQGLMQLMPGTARSLGVANAFDPAQAVDGAARMLSELITSFGGRVDLALAGYNAGPGAVRKYGGIPPYSETQNYVRRVTQYREALR